MLGRPDTGGQVVYILDQVRALEHEMRDRMAIQGVQVNPQIIVVTRLIPDADGTTCNQPLEKIQGTDHAWIVRVPFHHPNGEIVREWISRFEIWPIWNFATMSRRALARLGGGRPYHRQLFRRQLVASCCLRGWRDQATSMRWTDPNTASALYWEANDRSTLRCSTPPIDRMTKQTSYPALSEIATHSIGSTRAIVRYPAGLYGCSTASTVRPKFNIVSGPMRPISL